MFPYGSDVSPINFQVEDEMSPVRERYGEAFWRAHHEAWIPSELNQREYCEACGIPLNAFSSWRAKFKAEPQPPARKMLYRRGGLSHALSHGLIISHGLSHGLSHDLPGSGPIAPPAREVVVGCWAKQTNGRYFGGDAAGFALLRGSSAPRDRGTCSVPVEAEITPAAAPLFATVEITSGFSGRGK